MYVCNYIIQTLWGCRQQERLRHVTCCESLLVCLPDLRSMCADCKATSWLHISDDSQARRSVVISEPELLSFVCCCNDQRFEVTTWEVSILWKRSSSRASIVISYWSCMAFLLMPSVSSGEFFMQAKRYSEVNWGRKHGYYSFIAEWRHSPSFESCFRI